MGSTQLSKASIAFGALFPMGLMLGAFSPRDQTPLARRRAIDPLVLGRQRRDVGHRLGLHQAVGLQFGFRAELMLRWVAYLLATGILVSFTVEARSRGGLPAMEIARAAD